MDLRKFCTIGGLALAASVTVGMGGAFAQQQCTCVIPASTGPVGSISRASSDVFHTGSPGSLGRVAATAGSALVSGSVVTTGAVASADINLGQDCKFALGGSMRMQITPMDGGLCVQVFDESVSVPVSGSSAGVVLAGALGGGVLLSLGFLQSVSK